MIDRLEQGSDYHKVLKKINKRIAPFSGFKWLIWQKDICNKSAMTFFGCSLNLIPICCLLECFFSSK